MHDGAPARTTPPTRARLRQTYGFARTPRWLAGHALAGVLLIAFVVAGFWQLSRHGTQRDANTAAAERLSLPALNAEQLFEAVADSEPIAHLEHRSVHLRIGRFDWHQAVRIRNRSLGGLAGCHLAVPAAVPTEEPVAAPDGRPATEPRDGDSSASAAPRGVLIVAGWLPQRSCEPLRAETGAGAGVDVGTDTGTDVGTSTDAVAVTVAQEALSGASQITGRVRLSQERGLLGPADPAQGRLESLARTDVARIDAQTALDLAPVYAELVSAARPDGSAIELGGSPGVGTSAGRWLPQPLPPPDLDAGPHLGYALQWFSFAAVAVIGYTLVLRHQARQGASEQIRDD